MGRLPISGTLSKWGDAPFSYLRGVRPKIWSRSPTNTRPSQVIAKLLESGRQARRNFLMYLRQFLRHLFWQEVAGRHHAALRLDGGAILPRLQNVVHAMEWPFLRPQHEQRTLNFFVEVHLIVLKVNRGSRAIVLANGMDRSRLAERPQVFSKNGWTNPVR